MRPMSVLSRILCGAVLVFGIQAEERALSFVSARTLENVEAVYCRAGAYLPEALKKISWILRDPWNGEVKTVDPKLLDFLFELRRKVGSKAAYTVISGYRSAETNARLRQNRSGIAENSLHLSAKAIDVRLPGVALSDLRQAALDLRLGGVGYYPESNFIHLDVGRFRSW